MRQINRSAILLNLILTSSAMSDVPFQPLADFGKGGTPIDVNADGVIAGTLRTADDSDSVPVIWQTPTSAPTVLPTVSGGFATAINSSGQVAGVEFLAFGSGGKAVVWDNGEKFVLPDLGSGASASDISESGVIVGSVTTADNQYLACRWVDRQLELLPVPAFSADAQQVWSFARSINSAGVITGSIQGASGTPSISLRWDASGAVSEVVTTGLETKGIAIDNSGSVLLTGYFDGNGSSRGPARVQADGTLVTLPVPPELFAGAPGNCMSRTGVVAGYCYANDAEGNFIIQAVAWPNDEFTRLAMPQGMKYAFPYGVGSNGLVFGNASDGTSNYAVPGYWALPVEASVVQSGTASGSPGDTVQLTATSTRMSGAGNRGHSVLARTNDRPLGLGLTDDQGRALITCGIPEDFQGSLLTVQVIDESGAASISMIEVTTTCSQADLDGDGVVGGADLAMLLVQFGGTGPGDLDGSGRVDFGDVAMLLLDWTA